MGDRRKKIELEALDLLRQMIRREEGRLAPLEKNIGIMEGLVSEGKFQEAEKFVPGIVYEMKKKKTLDELELQEFKKFKKTMFKELHAEAKKLRKQKIE